MPLSSKSNERLEFVGYGVLECITKFYLYRRFPKENEGFMTEKKISFVKNESIGKNRFEYDIKVWDSTIQNGTLIKNEQYKFANPVLLIKPESSLVRESQIRKLENNFSNFSIDEIDNSTHMIIFEKPFEISEKIMQFIK